MAFLAAAVPYIAAASTVIGVAGSIQQGQAQQQQAQAQALALRNQANADAAAGQRQAIEARRQTSYLVSRGQALAAASGAGATDPTVTNLLGRLSGEGEYHALTSLYEGGTRAGNAISGAQADVNAGNAAARSGFLSGISKGLSGAANVNTLLTGSTSIASKYQQ